MSKDPLRLLFLADTHVPRRARALPAQVWQEVHRADVVFHAGDWQVPELLDELESRARRLVGVWGNNDGSELRERLPETARVEIGGIRFAMTHETGPARGREKRMAAAFSDADVLVFGHSHIPWDTVAGDETANPGLRLLNPGSPTDRRRQPQCTLMTAQTVNGRLIDVRLVPVDRSR
ncbi:metallophosphoesterase family protein [Citricoccus sp. GCM10030269]|uniref:metallophosphoesterase family protein n=1 Tax=Citricoccus sp. GCM10030269 TaxID=3273388 RepID=UPI00360B2F92